MVATDSEAMAPRTAGMLPFSSRSSALAPRPMREPTVSKRLVSRKAKVTTREAQVGDLREVHLRGRWSKRGDGQAAGEVRKQAGVAGGRVGHVEAAELADDAQDPGDEDAQQDVALDVSGHEHGGDDEAPAEEDDADAGRVEGAVGHATGEREDGDQGGLAGDHEAGALEADDGDEQANARGDGVLEVERDGLEDLVAQAREGYHGKDRALEEDGRERHLPAVAHAQHHGVGEVGVQSHAGNQHEGVIGEKRHDAGAQEADEGGRGEDGAGVHAGRGHDGGVDGQHVGGRDEGGETGEHLHAHRGPTLLQVEQTVQRFFHGLAPLDRREALPAQRGCGGGSGIGLSLFRGSRLGSREPGCMLATPASGDMDYQEFSRMIISYSRQR